MSPPRGQDVVNVAPDKCQLLDLHNHTRASYDGSNTYYDYERGFDEGLFHALAVTDHNTIEGAVEFAERGRFPVIIGEEVDTADGELVGLFVEAPLPLHRRAVETAEAIHAQGGLVYLQHPFYRFIRRPLRRDVMDDLARRDLIDVVE